MRSFRLFRSLTIAAASLLLVISGSMVAQAAGPATYTVQVDAQPPLDEPWAFLRFFPSAITVHRGDVIDASWAGIDTPHTASLVPTTDPEGWRATNQCDGCPFATFVPDASLGGDDAQTDFNPPVAFPSDPTCGTSAASCSFDGSGVVSSGLQFPNPAAQPSYFVRIDAPVGSYSLMCLLHPGMEITVKVAKSQANIPSPANVAARAAKQASQASATDGEIADAQAQEVSSQDLGRGHILWTINAGGFSNNVTANEFLGAGLSIHVGDQLQVDATEEIHTATTPDTAANTVPFTMTQCEAPGPDIPASSPFDCANPSLFQIALNNQALAPTASNALADPAKFRNSGLLTFGSSGTFVAKAAGTYTFVCLVHGPEMQTTITVEP